MAQQPGTEGPVVSGGYAGDTPGAPAAQTLSLEGEVVEIFEKAGQRLAKIMLRPRTVLDVAAGEIVDVHLGDRVVISGLLTVDTVSPSSRADLEVRGSTGSPRPEVLEGRRNGGA